MIGNEGFALHCSESGICWMEYSILGTRGTAEQHMTSHGIIDTSSPFLQI